MFRKKKQQTTDIEGFSFIDLPGNTVIGERNDLNLPQTPNKGHLVLIGGAEDKNNDKIVLREILNIKKINQIVVIPSASSYPHDLGEKYIHAFRDLGIENVEVYDIRSQSEADEPRYIENIEKADLVFFTGGDQVKLYERLGETRLLEKIKQQYHQKGIVIAGTSAGAAIASNPLIHSGDGFGLIKKSITFDNGFGLIEKVTIDTHFHARSRLGRLTQAIIAQSHTNGIGIDEDTGIIIYPNNTFKVIGSGIVTVLSTKERTQSNYNQIEEFMPITCNDIQMGLLGAGTHFDLNKWQIVQMPDKSHLKLYHFTEHQFQH